MGFTPDLLIPTAAISKGPNFPDLAKNLVPTQTSKGFVSRKFRSRIQNLVREMVGRLCPWDIGTMGPTDCSSATEVFGVNELGLYQKMRGILSDALRNTR